MVKNLRTADIVTSYPYPGNMATANRVNFFIDSLISIGIEEINIICLKPIDKTKLKNIKNIKINLFYISSKKTSNLLTKVLTEILISIKIQKTIIKLKSDIRIYTIPSIFLVFNIYMSRNKICLIDFRDITWNYLDLKKISNKIISFILSQLVSLSLKKANIISVTNEYEKKYIKKLTDKKCIILKNGISNSKFFEISNLTRFKEISSTNRTISYIGNIGVAQNLKTLIEFSINEKNCNLRISGGGTEFKKISSLSKGKKNIKIMGPIEWKDIIIEYSKADILYAQITSDFYSAIPTKPFEYIACKRPVILGLPDGPAKEIFSSFNNVYICKPDDIRSLKIAYIKSLNFSKEKHFKNLERIKDNFIREDNITTFIKSFEEI